MYVGLTLRNRLEREFAGSGKLVNKWQVLSQYFERLMKTILNVDTKNLNFKV